jgi:hypothetical protein
MTEAVTRRLRQRFARDWGLELPDSLVRFHEFLVSLGAVERAAMREMQAEPFGVMDLFEDPDAAPRDGLDVRLHGRYHRDPPEFVTFMHGGDDGLHFGLWFDDGRTCTGVASYYNTGGGIDTPAGTPLEALRGVLEQVVRSVRDYADEGEDRREELAELDQLRAALMRFETGDRPQTGSEYQAGRQPERSGYRRFATLDGAGVLVPDYTDGCTDRPAPYSLASHELWTTLRPRLAPDSPALRGLAEEALRRCADGDETDALALGRDLHWIGGDSALTLELLTTAYRELGRPALAAIAEVHHAHRHLPTVTALRR